MNKGIAKRARHLLVERVAQKVAHRGLQMMIHVRVLSRAHSGQRTRGDVADGVAAGFARGEAGAGESAHRLRRLAMESSELDLAIPDAR